MVLVEFGVGDCEVFSDDVWWLLYMVMMADGDINVRNDEDIGVIPESRWFT